MTTCPLVSIGMPVYNGEAYVEAALRTLLAQDYPRLEIVVSDNASSDDTEAICRRLASEDGRIRYSRNAENIGGAANFLRVLQRSQGHYFMWAAHDDLWSPRFVTALVDALQARPEAVLATPRTVYIQTNGQPFPMADDRPAPGGSRLENLRAFLDDHATSWIYGLFQTAWLQRHAHELQSEGYPAWGGDVMWISSVLLRHPVVGAAEATIAKRVRSSSFAPKSEAEQIAFVLEMLWQLRRIVRRFSTDPAERRTATRWVWRYSYRQNFRRSTPLKTFRRVLRLPWTALRIWWQGGCRPAPANAGATVRVPADSSNSSRADAA